MTAFVGNRGLRGVCLLGACFARLECGDGGFEKMLEFIVDMHSDHTAQCRGYADITADYRKYCEEDQWQQHQERRLMWSGVMMMILSLGLVILLEAFTTPEGQDH